jgi:ribosomal protein S6E (S10)
MDTFYYIGQTGEENQTNFNISGKQFIREDLGIDVATGDIYNLKIQTGALNSRVTTIEGDYLTSAYISDSIVNGETDTAPSRNAVYDMSGFLQSQIDMSVTTGDATGITLQAVTDNGSTTTNFIDVGGISSVGAGTFDNDLKISNLDKSLIFSSSKAKIYYNESISGGLVQESKNGFSFYIDNENNEDTSKFRVYSNKTPDSDTSSIFQISQNGDTYISGNIINTALTNFTGDTSSSISFLNTATGTINTNLFSTGSNLQTQITTLNTATGTLKTALVSTGSDLSTRIFSTGSNLQTQITTLNTATGIIKTNLAATGSDLLARLISTGGSLTTSITTLNTATGTINTALATTGSDLSARLISTGGSLTTSITTLNTATGTINTNLATTGSNLQTQITTLNTATGIIKTNLAATGSDLSARLISTGGSLTTSITTLNTATGTINTALATTGSDLSARLISTGGSLTTSITTLNTATGTINTNLATTGSNLQTQITTLNTATGIIKTNLAATGSDLSARLISTGGSLTTSITTLNTATGTINTALATTGSDLSARLISTGGSLTTSITTLNTATGTINTNLATTGSNLQTQITTLNTATGIIKTNLAATGSDLSARLISTGGSLSTILATEGTSESTRILNPIGGSYQTSTPTKTGAIKITLPVSWTNTMLSFKVSVFDFAAGESFTIFLAGYNYSGGWYYTSAYIIGGTTVDRNFTVRFGHDGSNCCVYIGELASTWGYPQIGISEVLLGFSNYSASSWRTGWSISFEASAFSSVSSTITSTQLNRFVKGNLAVDGTITADNHATSTVTNGVTTSSPSEDAVFDFVEAKTFATGSNLQTQITTLNTATGTLKTALASTGSDLSTRIFSTGNNLQTQIDSIVVGTGSQSLQTVTNIGSTTTNAVTIQNDLTVGSSNALFVDDSSNFVGIGTNTNGSEIYSKFSISGSHNTALYQNIINGGNGQVGFAMARSGTTPVRWTTYVPGGSTSLNFFSSSNLMTLTTAGNLSTVGTITATNHATSTVTNGVTTSSPSEDAVFDFVEAKTFATGSNLQTQITTLNTATGTLKTALASTGSDLSTRIFSTGNNLQTQIDSIVVGTGSQSLQTVTNIGSTTTNAVTIQNDLTVGSSNALFVDDSSNFVGIGTNTNGSEIYSKFSISGSHNTALYQNIINGGNGQVGFAMARSGTTPVRWVTYVPGGSTSLNFFSSSNLMTLTTAGNLSTVGTITATNHATSTVTNGVTISSPSENAVYDFVEGKTFATGSNLQTQINNIVSYTGIVQTYNTGNIKNITTPTEINFGTTTFVDPVIASVDPSYVEVAGDGLYEIEYGIEIKNTGTLPSQVETSILINGLSNYGDVPIRSRASTTLGSGEYRSISKRFYTNLLDIDNIRIKINPNSAKLTVSSGSYMQVTRKN